MLQVDLVAKRARNLSALQKIDGNVLEIVSEASHTALYKFDAASTKWERYAMEGAVFITRNCLAPFYSLIVLNKIGPDDFILDLSTVQKAKMQDSYVMLRYTTGGAPIIMGFWLRDDQEREELLQSVTRAIAAGNTNKVSSFPSSLTMKLTAAAQQINNKKVTPVAAPIPTPPASYAAALGIPKQPILTPTPTTTTTTSTGASMQVSSSAAAILQAIGNGSGNGTGSGGGNSNSSVGGIVSAEGASSGAGGGAGMGLLKMLRAQPTPSTNNNSNSSSNNMAPTTSTISSSNSGQAFLTDREISAMKTNQHLTHPSHSHQGGSNTGSGSSTGTNTGSSGSSGNSAMNVVSSSVAVGSTVGVSSKGATSMLLAALQINTTATTTATTAATSTAGIVSASEAVPHTPLSMSYDTKMVPIPLSALLGTNLT